MKKSLVFSIALIYSISLCACGVEVTFPEQVDPQKTHIEEDTKENENKVDESSQTDVDIPEKTESDDVYDDLIELEPIHFEEGLIWGGLSEKRLSEISRRCWQTSPFSWARLLRISTIWSSACSSCAKW